MRAPDEPAVACAHLRVIRGGRVVLPDLSLTVPAGTITGLLGPSGSGKTTFLRCVVGVQEVAGGDVWVLGHPAGDPRLRHHVGYVTQQPSVYGDLTVRENLRYFADLTGATRTRVDEAMVEVSLLDHADHKVGRLSGGQRARASLAVALLSRPRLLVLDEPTVGLDPVLREDLWALFHRLAAEGRTLLVSSHVMDEADRCERLLLLRDGRLLFDDPPAALRRRTRCDDLDDAFLALVRSKEGVDHAEVAP
jgi:ABC-2 type transport system ATP-binding protein